MDSQLDSNPPQSQERIWTYEDEFKRLDSVLGVVLPTAVAGQAAAAAVVVVAPHLRAPLVGAFFVLGASAISAALGLNIGLAEPGDKIPADSPPERRRSKRTYTFVAMVLLVATIEVAGLAEVISSLL